MDYKYIEQLLERYWACQTMPEEEAILRTFFEQPSVPAHLAMWRDLFVYENIQAEEKLDTGFDERLCRLAGIENASTQVTAPVIVRARRLSLSRRLRPLYRAVASVAIVMVVGTAAQHIFNRPQEVMEWDYNPATYQDYYDNPKEAYETLDDGIRELRDVLNIPEKADSIGKNERPIIKG